MGNETSSLKIHRLLTAEDIKRLRAGFPEDAVGAKPPQDLEWGSWKDAWPTEVKQRLAEALNPPQNQQEISFEKYQQMAGNVVRGTTEERVKLLFHLVHERPLPEGKEPYQGHIKASQLVMFVEDVIRAASTLTIGSLTEVDAQQAATLAKSLIKDLAFPNQPAKKCLHAVPEQDLTLDFDAVERWTAIKCPLFDQLFRYALASSFGLQVVDDTVPLRGNLKLKPEDRNTIMTPADVFFLNANFPGKEGKQCWRQLFNSKKDGQSFSKFRGALTSKSAQCPTLILVREQDGHVFGGFATDPWKPGPNFYGKSACFLYHLHPRHYAYETTTYNTNYQYLNANAKTFPNGLGMGGQIDFFGLWIDEEYGKARCAPSCSSYACPQLSKEEYFHFDHVEIWGIGDESGEEDEDGVSALDRDPEAMAVMEMMGKTFISKDVKTADENDAKASK